MYVLHECPTFSTLEPLFHKHIRYGVVANIVVSHTTAGGSIPPIGTSTMSLILSGQVIVDRLLR
ncbi:hypothetical protein N7504_012115 [Penicillium tannophilum]|nr:hypothetical protein N7504_012115 [Penicillium tannophilum]